jgi:hypothetical protein
MLRKLTRLRVSLLVAVLVVAMTTGMMACSAPPKLQEASPPPTASHPSKSPSSTQEPKPSPEPEPPLEPPTTVSGYLAVRFLDVGQGDSIFIT